MIIKQEERERYSVALKAALELLNSNDTLDTDTLLKKLDPIQDLFATKNLPVYALESVLCRLNACDTEEENGLDTQELFEILENIEDIDEKLYSECISILNDFIAGDCSLDEAITKFEGLYDGLLL